MLLFFRQFHNDVRLARQYRAYLTFCLVDKRRPDAVIEFFGRYIEVSAVLNDFFEPTLYCLCTQKRDFQEIFDLVRQNAESVRKFVGDIVGISLCFDRCDSFVKRHSLRLVRNVFFGNKCVEIERYRAVGTRLHRFSALFKHRFVQKLYIEVVTYRVEVSVLFRAKQIAGAAQFKVAHGDTEARAELGVLFERFKALFGDLGQRAVLRECEISVRSARRTTYAAAYLVELRKSQTVRVVDYERVRVGNVNSRFDYARADENVDVSEQHRAPDVFEPLFFHFSVSRHYLRVRKFFLKFRRDRVYRFYDIMKVENLPFAVEFAADRVENYKVVVLKNVGLYRQTVARRFVEHRYIANAAHRHIERSRYRRRRERKYVDVARDLLYSLLLSNTETLFFVNDEKSEIFESNIFRQKSVRSNN